MLCPFEFQLKQFKYYWQMTKTFDCGLV